MWDADGNELLDFTLSQGPLIQGHSHPHVLERVMGQWRALSVDPETLLLIGIKAAVGYRKAYLPIER